jgi:hypothetical protein
MYVRSDAPLLRGAVKSGHPFIPCHRPASDCLLSKKVHIAWKRARNRNTKAMNTKKSIRSGVRLWDERVGVNHPFECSSGKT